jgi:hypothetical protein
VRNCARGKNGRAFRGDKRFPADVELVVAFEDLKGFIFAMMDVRGRAASGDVVRLHRADHAAGVAAVNPNDHRNAEDIYFLAAALGNLDWVHWVHLQMPNWFWWGIDYL